MRRKIAMIMSGIILASSATAIAVDYSDVPNGAWYKKYVTEISELNAFSGYEDGTFRPDNQITQEEFIKTVVCLLTDDIETTVQNPWNSKWSDWAVPYLDKAFELGLIKEDDKWWKVSEMLCTRGEMAKVITRAVEYLGEEEVADTSTYTAKLKDYARLNENYKPYILQAYAKGILSGYEDGTFRDDGLLTRAEASSVLVRLIDKDERVAEADPNEKLYDYFGRQVTWTEPLRTDVPKEYQVSIADHNVLSQSNYDESVSLGGSASEYPLVRAKGMMFEDLVLQSIRYEGDTITLTVPDLLPESQEWSINIEYWDIDKDYDFSMIKNHYVGEAGTFEFNDIKVLDRISIIVYPVDSDNFISGIFIENGVNLSLTRKDKPEVSFNNLRGINNKITGVKKDFEWVQGRGYKEYIKDYQFDEDDIEIEW